jgi:uncharacterized protein (UPF0332 family)
MTFHWLDYLALAKSLINAQLILPTSDEARQRAAISRAYYAAFCTTRNYLRQQLGNPELFADEKAHRKVREELVLKNSKTADQLAKLLLEVHRERKRADYDDEYAAAKNISIVIQRVERILSLLEQNP